MKKIFLPLLLILCFNAYGLTVYKTVDKHGQVTFSTTKSANSTPIEIAPTHTIPTQKKTPEAAVTIGSKPEAQQDASTQTTQTQTQVPAETNVNQRVNTLLSLQRNIKTARNNVEQTKIHYTQASAKARLAKRQLDNAIGGSKKMVSNNINSDNFATQNHSHKALIYALSQKSVFAAQQKQQAYEQLQHSEQALQDAKNAVINFYREN